MKPKAVSGLSVLASSLAVCAASLTLGGCRAIWYEHFSWDNPGREPARPVFPLEPKPVRRWPAGTPHVTEVQGTVFSGQPDEAGFAYAAVQGVKTVVNVRDESEMAELGFDERALVESLGMKYVHIPICLGAGSTEAYFDAVKYVSISPGMGHVKPHSLIHDATGDRVGAVWAIYSWWQYGRGEDAAVKTGRKAGLHSEAMIAEVRRVLAR